MFIFSTFDAITGRAPELKRLAIDPNAEYIWDLSPDGTRIALLKTLRRRDTILFSEGPIRIISLNGRPSLDLTVPGRTNFGEYLDWAPDGNGLFVSNPVPGGQALLYVDLLGNAQVLWIQKREGSSPRGVPSRRKTSCGSREKREQQRLDDGELLNVVRVRACWLVDSWL